MITVYYDGICSMCAREIAHYKRIAPEGAFAWIDVTKQPQALEKHGISLADGLRALHAEDAHGTLHVGVDAFVLIWRELRYWKLLAVLGTLPGIYPLAKWLYARFAAYRFKRLSHCQAAARDG